jgi:DNA-binding transcriptional LysR family regulator
MHAPWWRAHFGESAPTPDHVVAEAPSLDELLAWTTSGRCACVLPSYWVEREVRKKALVVLEPSLGGRPRRRSGQTATNTIYLAWRRGAVPSARVRALRDALTR